MGPTTALNHDLASASVSRTVRWLGAALLAGAFLVVGFVAAWFVVGEETAGPPAQPTETAAPEGAASIDSTSVPPTPVPTATPIPTPTPLPTPLPLAEAVPLGDLNDLLAPPMPDCGLVRNDEIVAGTVTLTCIEDWSSVPVASVSEGRIVHVVRGDFGPSDTTPRSDGVPLWSWAEQALLGPHVVVDHGPLGGASNVQTVYAGLDLIADDIRVGLPVEVGHELGTVGGPSASLQFGVWVDNTRQDGVRVLAEAPPAEEQLAVAQALGAVVASPTDPQCPLSLGFGQLPGAARAYRNGTHQGIDFGCGAADRSAFAIADGTVVYLVDDYQDPSVPEREALLQRAGIAGFTPHWTLLMLYGNVVIIDHGEIPGAGRVVTISAHLEEVDPAVSLGATVTQGQRLGELGNRGTNASALGIRGANDPSLHLHWELFIDNWYLGSGLDGVTVSRLISAALCGAAETPGCPA